MREFSRLWQMGLVLALCVISLNACKDNPLTDKHGDKNCALKCENTFKGQPLNNVAVQGCINGCGCTYTSTTTYSCD